MTPTLGDLGVTPGSGFAMWLIRVVTRCPQASHAFIYIGDGRPDGTNIIEGEPGGARYGRASEYATVHWLTNLSKPLTDQQRVEAVNWAKLQRGVPYSWLDDLAIGLKDTFGFRWWSKKRLESDKTLMCSQLCVLAYDQAGVELFPGVPAGGVSPANLYFLNQERSNA